MPGRARFSCGIQIATIRDAEVADRLIRRSTQKRWDRYLDPQTPNGISGGRSRLIILSRVMAAGGGSNGRKESRAHVCMYTLL